MSKYLGISVALRAVAYLAQKRKHWCKGEADNGNKGFCLAGRIIVESSVQHPEDADLQDLAGRQAEAVLCSAIGTENMLRWNDAWYRTHESIKRLHRKLQEKYAHAA